MYLAGRSDEKTIVYHNSRIIDAFRMCKNCYAGRLQQLRQRCVHYCIGKKFDLKRQTAIRILAAAESKHSLQVTDSVGNSYTASFTTPLHWNFHHNIYLQLEKDMKIYRVDNDKFPQHPMPPQSEGFPVVLSGGKK